jgi:NAD(P)H-hydrate epimerase
VGWGVTVVLKGAFTVVADPDGHVAISSWALPALGSAGTGDVLAGAIAGLLAQGVPPFEAACSAVYLHGAAGALAASDGGDPTAGLLAGDVADRLPAAMGTVRRGELPGGAFA